MSKKLQNNLEDNGVFANYDLGCAAALVTANFVLLTLDRENPRKVRFIFRREAGIEKVADDFWSDRLEQKSRSFWDNIKNLKNRLYSD
ncbi:DUF5659 domain-containing protein [Patescibacteria group bacterium]